MPYIADLIADSTGTYEPLRTNNWSLELAIPPLARVSAGVTMGGLRDDILRVSLRTCGFPADTVELIEIPYANENRKVAGRVTRDNITVVFNDWVNRSVYDTLKAWHQLVFDPETGAIGYAKDYKSTGTLINMGPDLSPVRSIMVHGIWPSKVTANDLDQAGNDQVQVTVDFVIDKIDLPKIETSATTG